MKFQSAAVPGILRVYSSVPRLTSFSLSPKFQESSSSAQTEYREALSISYSVEPFESHSRFHDGKTYRWIEENTLKFEFPIAPLVSLIARLRINEQSAEIAVNTAYHYLGRLSVGNIPSAGWLLRDVTSLLLSRNNYALVYAAGVDINGRALVIVGLTNSGKSTLVRHLVSHHSAKVLGDDMIVIDREGRVYACPLVPTTAAINRLAENPSKLSDVIVLQPGAEMPIQPLDYEQMIKKVYASNQTNLKFSANSFLAAYSFFADSDPIGFAIDKERNVISEALGHASGLLVGGERSMQIEVVERVLGGMNA